MRIRTIKPSFFLHDVLFDLEKSTKLPVRLAFIGLWCAADREGRFEWRPRMLKPCILPHDNCDFDAILTALESKGFICKYGEHGQFGFIPGFSAHQRINTREAQSTLPEPPDTCTHVHAHVTHVHAEGEGKGREGNKEGKGKEGVADARGGAVAVKPESDPIMDIPRELQTPEFVKAWRQWIECRKAHKKPKSWPALFNAQLQWLVQFGAHHAVEVLNQSMRNGWQGLFPPKGNGFAVQAKPQTWHDEEAADLIAFAARMEKGK